MRRGSFSSLIRLDEDPAGRIVELLDDIESRDTWFANTGGCIRDRSFLECVDKLGLNLNFDVNDEHELWDS